MSNEGTSYSKLGNAYPTTEITARQTDLMATLRTLSSKPSNKKCADCGTTPTNWASVNLGIFLCINCAQVHRGIGTHVTKVKNLLGTYLWYPDELQRMEEVGNERSNAMYLANCPNPDTSNMRKLIEDKYVHKRWAKN